MTEFVFDNNGYLLPNDEPVLADSTSVNYHFGNSSVSRRHLWDSVEKLLSLLSLYLLPVNEVWLDGSFISQKTNPNDVDLVIFVNYSSFRATRDTLNTLSTSFADLDVKWIPVLEATDDLSSAINSLERMKWFILFTSDRNGVPKGFVSLKMA